MGLVYGPVQDIVATLLDLQSNLPAQTLSFLLPTPTALLPRQQDVRQHVPIKFEHRTADGLWVKSQCWDLHGQQLCQVIIAWCSTTWLILSMVSHTSSGLGPTT